MPPRILAIFVLACGFIAAQTAKEWIAEGVDAYKAAQYDEAVDNFQQAAAADPQSVQAHLYLATAYLATQNTQNAVAARKEFERVLELDAKNRPALTALARMALQQAGQAGGADRARLFEEARERYQRLLAEDPEDKHVHYALGVIAWSKFYPAYKAARERSGLQPYEPGPFKDSKLRAAMRREWGASIEEGIEHLEHAIAIDPEYEDAMVHLNMLIRERADFADHPYLYQAQMIKAETWAKKAVDVQQRKAAAGAPANPGQLVIAPPLPPAN